MNMTTILIEDFVRTIWDVSQLLLDNPLQITRCEDTYILYNKDTEYYDLYKPSIDHKIPLSRGGTNELNNLHFVTLFENLAKRDMTMEEWEEFKIKTNTTSTLFI